MIQVGLQRTLHAIYTHAARIRTRSVFLPLGGKDQLRYGMVPAIRGPK